MNLQQVINDLIVIAEEAGTLVMNYYGKVVNSGKTVGEAYDATVSELKTSLTSADILCQEFILGRLLGKYRAFGVYSEEDSEETALLESKFSHRKTLKEGQYTLLIDPIDGTTNFLNTNPLNIGRKGDPLNKDRFGVQITLMFGNQIIGGVTHLPRLQKTIATFEGGPTTVNGRTIRLRKRIFENGNPIRIGHCIDRTYLDLDREGLSRLFPHQVSFGASCYTSYALLSQEIDAWLINRTELLDFGFTALAYENAGGFVGGVDSRKISIRDLLQQTKNGLELMGFMLLTPDASYHRALMEFVSHGAH